MGKIGGRNDAMKPANNNRLVSERPLWAGVKRLLSALEQRKASAAAEAYFRAGRHLEIIEGGKHDLKTA